MSQDKIMQLLGQIGAALGAYALDVAGAIAIIVIGWIVANWLHGLVGRALDRSHFIDGTLRPFIASLVRYSTLVFVGVAVLAQFGVQTTSIIAVLGAAGLAVGLALQGTLSNIAAGFMLLLLRPFKIGDYIDAEGVAGTVDTIGLFACELRTFDGVYISVPNATIWNRTIKNFSRLPTRRIDVAVGIGYGDDLDKAMVVLNAILAGDPRVLAEPAAQVMVSALADSAVSINMRCWVKAGDYWQTMFDLNRAAKLRLDAEGISIPYPQREIRIVERRDAAK